MFEQFGFELVEPGLAFFTFLASAAANAAASNGDASSQTLASQSGDISSGPVSFGPIELGGISRGLSVPKLPKDPITLAIIAAVVLVGIVAFARR